MRIVTWNCEGGRLPERAAMLDSLAPDLVVLQECRRPVDGVDDGSWVWFGEEPGRGVGVMARAGWRVARGPVSEAVSHSAFPVIVTRDAAAPDPLHVLVICSEPRPSYVTAVRNALDGYAGFLRERPAIVLGDFNCSPAFAPATRPRGHVALADQLRALGLVSAWHAHATARGADPAVEPPTLYFQRKEARPFHIDYCFLPEAWVPGIREVTVGGYAEWKDRSDHRPVLVDVEPASPAA